MESVDVSGEANTTTNNPHLVQAESVDLLNENSCSEVTPVHIITKLNTDQSLQKQNCDENIIGKVKTISHERKTPTVFTQSTNPSEKITSWPRDSIRHLRQSAEDLISRTCKPSVPKADLQSDCRYNNSSGNLVSHIPHVDHVVSTGGSVSAPALTEVTQSELVIPRNAERKREHKKMPKIVIDKASDDESDCTTDEEFDLDQYYGKQVVLSEWEEICWDLRVTEL